MTAFNALIKAYTPRQRFSTLPADGKKKYLKYFFSKQCLLKGRLLRTKVNDVLVGGTASCLAVTFEDEGLWESIVQAAGSVPTVAIACNITSQAFLISSFVMVSGGAMRMQWEANKNQSVNTPLAMQVSITFLLKSKFSNSTAIINPRA